MSVEDQYPSVEELRNAMSKVRAFPLARNTFYRDAPVASYVLHGTGPLYGLKRGARYSPPDSFPVLYFAADRLLAQLETAHHLSRYLPEDPSEQIDLLHRNISSLQAEQILQILEDMAISDEGYEANALLSEYLDIPIVSALISKDPALLKVFLEQRPNLGCKPLKSSLDTSRLNIAVRISARGVLDLSDSETLQVLKINHDDLIKPTESWQSANKNELSITERIGLAAWDAPGIDGILAPTALPKETQSSLVKQPLNLVLFMHEEEPHRPRSAQVNIEIEDDFVQLTKLFWIHRPQWLLDALEEHEPEAARVIRRLAK